jgi:alkylhydroperoxidase family enzyme
MGHVLFTSAVADVPAEEILDLEAKEKADPKRAAVYAFARKLTLTPGEMTRADADRLREHVTDEQIVELVLAVCRYNTMNRLAEGLGVPLERTNVFAPPAAASGAAAEGPKEESKR